MRVRELARHWVSLGHSVTVLTAFPSHPTGRVYPGYRNRIWRPVGSECQDGVRVVRTWLIPRPNRRAWERMVSYASFAASASVTSLFTGGFDVVIATSPQLLVGLVGWWRTRLRRALFVFEVRDLWPESAVATELGSQGSPLVGALGRLARFLYRRADHIVTVTDAMRAYLVENQGVGRDKIDVIGAGVDVDLFHPAEPDAAASSSWDVDGRFVVSYVGTHGASQGLEQVLDAAGSLSDRAPEMVFLFAGEGAEKARLEALARERGLRNVRFIDQQPLHRVPSLLAASHIGLAILRDDQLFKTVIPTKIYEYMACAMPIVSNIPGETQRLLERVGAGVSVPPGDPHALAEAILALRDDPHGRTAMGQCGRRHVCASRTWSRQAELYIRVLTELVDSNGNGEKKNRDAES